MSYHLVGVKSGETYLSQKTRAELMSLAMKKFPSYKKIQENSTRETLVEPYPEPMKVVKVNEWNWGWGV